MVQALKEIQEEIDYLERECDQQWHDDWGRERVKEIRAKIRGLERAKIIIYRNGGK